MFQGGLVCCAACALLACGADCPDGYRKLSDKCVADATHGVLAEADGGMREWNPDAGRERNAGGHGGKDSAPEIDASSDSAADGGKRSVGGSGGEEPHHSPAGGRGGAGGSVSGDGGGGDGGSEAGAPAARGGGEAGAAPPVGGQMSQPDPPARGAEVGSSFLFWGSGAVTYPFAGSSLLRSERLTAGKYLVTGKLNVTNPSASALEVKCSVGLDQALDMESLSVPPADSSGPSTISVILMCLGPTGGTVDAQRAFLTCTCASGDACNGLELNGLGIITKLVAADSGTIALTAPAGN